MTQTPVAYIVFNRPGCTRETFAALRAQRPGRLFIIADGPRPDHPSDVERCAEVRAIVEEVDWPCEVSRDYAESNLGLKRRVSTGLDWVFGQVERAIVLEDDCVAHPDFFTLCEQLLERYADDERVWVITGDNFQDGHRRGSAAYYFSKYPHCWGWGTWRRAWANYQGDIPFWNEWRNTSGWRRTVPIRAEQTYWEAIFDKVDHREINSWAYPWTACVWHGGGLTATPNVNLVTNIGFGAEATHTTGSAETSVLSAAPLGPLVHPAHVQQDRDADRYVFHHTFGGVRSLRYVGTRGFPRRVIRKIRRAAGRLIGNRR